MPGWLIGVLAGTLPTFGTAIVTLIWKSATILSRIETRLEGMDRRLELLENKVVPVPSDLDSGRE